MDRKASQTAIASAYTRAYHATFDSPKIFDDFLARQLFTQEELDSMGRGMLEFLKFFDPERANSCPDEASALAWAMRLHITSLTISRARYTEDSLDAAIHQGIKQYVILGAGMDTFAFRKADQLSQLHVFELDHPATQALKRKRLAELGWELPAHLHFVPLDFTKDTITTALQHSMYDSQARGFFSWLGVSYYLNRDVVFDTLRAIADVAPTGSTIVFDYLDTDAFDPEKSTARLQKMLRVLRQMGEPMESVFDPATLGTDLKRVGLYLSENLSPSDIEDRYFKRRTDGYNAFEHVYFAKAVVA